MTYDVHLADTFQKSIKALKKKYPLRPGGSPQALQTPPHDGRPALSDHYGTQ